MLLTKTVIFSLKKNTITKITATGKKNRRKTTRESEKYAV